MGGCQIDNLIELPDERLRCKSYENDGAVIVIRAASISTGAICPYCGKASEKVHSHYTRKLQDLPIQGKKVKPLLDNKKYFCINPECGHKTFAEQFTFFEPKSAWTKRLGKEILRVALTQSSVSASKYLRGSVADVSKSTICNLLKKGRKG